ncbi:AAA family ATPase [Clavibacter michiganensis]|uniref:AAA family ATPase n=1 Tax=Clavibacter michiganensis TaxID=28447 RepID=UPI0009A6C55B|nr:SMC family ATPase [Clavibacter michiganensis]MBF4637470.1 SMC family ATPase [Clavibacter michiganensis subsp. michiganensis]MDO4029402.1 SMC family ATPase [Clavibacter michiganensis]MDO4124434.1 SMC family ATPase [Clavibacter michiganensis]MDO4140676.1 SMC family ATPase [Clavibacter michiganensis]MWJ05728.1 SMC family ATPase [Clavibacter michiganensis subsp. michiganensis]
MDLHRLSVQAIGPFAGEHVIDFAELGRSGLFLLEGPTGSGKSTLIDAVVFALYGSLASEGSSRDRLHSHHAAPGVEPYVELVFETAAGIHRVRRSPQHQRPKARGTGTTNQNAAATLVRLSSPDADAGEVIGTSTQEVGTEVARIVGLTRAQFVQTVVLPQGEFAEFLRSTGEQRRLVLQSLFGTAVYERTAAQLGEMRKAAKARTDAADAKVAEALTGLREATRVDALEIADAPDTVRLLAELADAAETARADEERTRQGAATALADAERVSRALDRRRALIAREEAVRAAAEEIAGLARRVGEARRAAAVAGQLAARDRADAARTAAEVADDDARAACRTERPALASATAPALAGRRDALVAELATLADAEARERGLPRRRADVRAAEDAVAAREAEADAAEAPLAGRPAGRIPLVEARDAAAAAAGGVDQARAAVAEAEATRRRVAELEGLEARIRAARDALDARSAAATTAVRHEAELRQRKIRGLAGELAAELEDGVPCPVCGAVDHPHPAPSAPGHPDDDEIERAADARARAERAQGDAVAALSAETARHEVAAAALDGITAEAADAGVAARAARLAVAEAAGGALRAAEAAVVAHDAETERIRARRDDARAALSGLRERVIRARELLTEDEAAVRAALADRDGDGTAGTAHTADDDTAPVPRVAALVADRAAERALVDRLIALGTARERTAAEAAARTAELAQALADRAFATEEEARAAALPPAELEAAAGRVAAHEREQAVVAEGLVDPEVASLTGAEDPDPDAARAALDAAQAAARASAERAARARDRADRSASALARHDAARRESARAGDQARAAIRMAEVANAITPENTRGTTLGTYVLLRRFEDVVQAANARLRIMSSGRYELEVSEEREATSRSRKTGLALQIRDHVVDRVREPASFSGGETFYASLALALGLADVVQAEAGGLQLGTLFVDEGFGTLDPETLDAVMSELGRLSSGGRTVGIVSHVEELKQRVADRIEVRRRADGSSTLTSTVADPA